MWFSNWLLLTLSLLTVHLADAKDSLRITYPTTPQQYRLFGKPTFFFDSTWPNITLELWQGPDDEGRTDMEYLLREEQPPGLLAQIDRMTQAA